MQTPRQHSGDAPSRAAFLSSGVAWRQQQLWQPGAPLRDAHSAGSGPPVSNSEATLTYAHACYSLLLCVSVVLQVATAIRGAIILAKMSVIPVRRGYWGNKIGKVRVRHYESF